MGFIQFQIVLAITSKKQLEDIQMNFNKRIAPGGGSTT